jgi:hypothetical protein
MIPELQRRAVSSVWYLCREEPARCQPDGAACHATDKIRTGHHLKTARALRLVVPDKLLTLADEVIG